MFSSPSPSSNTLLRGVTPETWHNDDHTLREFLASFSVPERVANAGEISLVTSEEDVKKSFCTWRESTSTSPSGRHLGHYKAEIKHPVLLLLCLTKFLYIAVQSGISIPHGAMLSSYH